MKFSRSTLFQRSRDTRFLFRAAILIGVVSVVVAQLISLLTVNADRAPSPLEHLTREGSGPGSGSRPDPRSIEEWAREIRREAAPADGERFHGDGETLPGPPLPEMGPPSEDAVPRLETPEALEDLLDRMTRSGLASPERALLASLARGLLGDEGEVVAAIRQLETASAEVPPRRHAAEFLGEVRSRAGDWDGAIAAFRLEVDRYPGEARPALHRLIVLLRQESRMEELGELLSREDLRDHVSIFDRIELAIAERDYLGLLGLTIRWDLAFDDPWLVPLSLFAALIWFVIITQFSGEWKRKGWLYLAAFVLGHLSASATLYVGLLQDRLLHFTHDPNAPIVDQLIYCIAGIGLREEFLKLLLLVPLVPVLARRDHEIDALVCAGLVGLGFAFNENTGYIFRGGGEFGTWSRFLTANFFHVALTGVAGLSLVRCWRRPRRQWDNFLYDFLIVVAAHGAYDALLMVPPLMEYGIISIVIFALIAYLFLDQALHLMRPQSSMTISPLAVFVLGSALLMGVVLCYASWAVPFRSAISAYLNGLGGMIAVVFVFISRLRTL